METRGRGRGSPKPMNVERRAGFTVSLETSQTAMHFREKPRGTVGASLRKIIPRVEGGSLPPSLSVSYPLTLSRNVETSFQHDSMPRSCKCESTLLRALKVVLLEGSPLSSGPGPFTEKKNRRVRTTRTPSGRKIAEEYVPDLTSRGNCACATSYLRAIVSVVVE